MFKTFKLQEGVIPNCFFSTNFDDWIPANFDSPSFSHDGMWEITFDLALSVIWQQRNEQFFFNYQKVPSVLNIVNQIFIIKVNVLISY